MTIYKHVSPERVSDSEDHNVIKSLPKSDFAAKVSSQVSEDTEDDRYEYFSDEDEAKKAKKKSKGKTITK